MHRGSAGRPQRSLSIDGFETRVTATERSVAVTPLDPRSLELGGARRREPTVLFVGYDPELPSFRHRLLNTEPEFQRRGWRVEVERFDRGGYFRRVFARRALFCRAELVVLSKINMSAAEIALLGRYAKRVAFDFDDAIYVRKPRGAEQSPDRSRWRASKFRAVCRRADVVIAGNETLAAAARPHARRLRVVPTPVACGPEPRAKDVESQTIVWIGMPENLGYLDAVRPALAGLRERFPRLRLRVVSSAFPDWEDVALERVPWRPGIEHEVLATATVGIMPLADDAWTRGKCAFKLLQYMAAAIPCVASPVGANRDVVVHAETGYLASSSEEWTDALATLLADRELRATMGRAGRRRALERFDTDVVAPEMVDALLSALA